MACEVRLTAQAELEVVNIVAYLAESLCNSQAADRFLDELDALMTRLEQAPDLYPACAEPRLRSLGYRKAPLMRYVALYRQVGTDQVVIGHVFHMSQDYARLV